MPRQDKSIDQDFLWDVLDNGLDCIAQAREVQRQAYITIDDELGISAKASPLSIFRNLNEFI